MSRKSEYTLDLVVKGDDARNAIRALEDELKGLRDRARKATEKAGLADSLKAAESAIGTMKAKMADMAQSMGGDFDDILKAYERSSGKLIDQFEVQYAELEKGRQGKESEYYSLREALEQQKQQVAFLEKHGENSLFASQRFDEIQKRLEALGYEQIEAQIEKNRQIRAGLAEIAREAKNDREKARLAKANAEAERANAEAEKALANEKRKLEYLEREHTDARFKQKGLLRTAETEINGLKTRLAEAQKSGNLDEAKRLADSLKAAEANREEEAKTIAKKLDDLEKQIARQRISVDIAEDQKRITAEETRQTKHADVDARAKRRADEVGSVADELRKLEELEKAYLDAKARRESWKQDARVELKGLTGKLADAQKAGDRAETTRLKGQIQETEGKRDSQDRESAKKLAELKEQIELQRTSVELAKAQRRVDAEAAEAKRKEKYDKLEELKAKQRAARSTAERAMLKQQIALQKAYIKHVEATEKAQMRNGDAIQKAITKTEKMAKAWEATKKAIGTVTNLAHKAAKSVAGVTQFAYNVTGMVGGAARAGKAAFGMISGGISNVAAVADREVEKERLANRVKGFGMDDAKDMMSRLYIQTGADYGVIVDAINRVQNVLKSNDKGELIAAAATEIRYPGAAQTFASSNTRADTADFARYGNRLKAMQNATGASDEQVMASTELINNLKPESFRNASVTELQTVYLGLQNSGAFDSQGELDKAFRRFARERAESGQNAFEFARNYDWNKAIEGKRNKLQASNTLAQIDWEKMGGALNKPEEQQSQERSASESMAMKMRQMEEKKNELMLKLIPAVLPIVEKLADLISGPTGSKIIDGLVSLFETVIPMLEPVFDVLKKVMDFLNNYVLKPLKEALEWVARRFGDNDTATPQNAAGGFAFMPSIVGERGPEAIIPLDYSRAQRAENIANTVNQTFNMGNSQTTALSLAQAVRSRDFTRAMTDNRFFTRRCGAF